MEKKTFLWYMNCCVNVSQLLTHPVRLPPPTPVAYTAVAPSSLLSPTSNSLGCVCVKVEPSTFSPYCHLISLIVRGKTGTGTLPLCPLCASLIIAAHNKQKRRVRKINWCETFLDFRSSFDRLAFIFYSVIFLSTT